MDPLSGFHPLPITGLVFRHYRGKQDLPAMLDVFQSIKTKDHKHVLEELYPAIACEE